MAVVARADRDEIPAARDQRIGRGGVLGAGRYVQNGGRRKNRTAQKYEAHDRMLRSRSPQRPGPHRGTHNAAEPRHSTVREEEQVQVPAPFDYAVATSLDDAIARLAADGDARLIAGGHSLLPMMKLRLATPSALIDISPLEHDLRYIRENGTGVAIGALATHRDVLASPLLAERARTLVDAERVIADPLVRNMGTVGGSIAHGDPAEDLPAALLTLDAVVAVRGPNGAAREIALEEFYQGPYMTVLEPAEIVVEIRLPRAIEKGAYLKVERRAGDWAAAALGFSCDLSGGTLKNVRIGLCAVGAYATRARKAEAALENHPPESAVLRTAAEAAAAECEPVTDARGSETYKRNLIRTLLPRAVERAVGAASSNGGT